MNDPQSAAIVLVRVIAYSKEIRGGAPVCAYLNP